MKRFRLIVAIGLCIALAGAVFLFSQITFFATVSNDANHIIPSINIRDPRLTPDVLFEEVVSIASSTMEAATGTFATLHLPNTTQIIETNFVVQNVPFVSQAPFGDWDDSRQQDGCEEISALMAMAWVKGQSLSREQALEQLFAISAYEEATYGSYHDTSANDTVQRIFNEYLGYQHVEVIENVTKEAIKRELTLGNLMITPMDGQLLNNPYYTPPGPERHMVVVIGYDPVTDEFITNDPGTRRGEGYRYGAFDFVSAIRDYPTGNHIPISSTPRSAMIVVRK